MESIRSDAMLARPDATRAPWMGVAPVPQPTIRTGSGPQLTVSRLSDRLAYVCLEDAIAIYIPGDRDAFHLTHELQRRGGRRLFVPAPLISVVPADQPHSIESSRPGETLRMTLGSAALQEDEGSAFQRPFRTVNARWATLDPFLRATGNALRAQLDAYGNPPASFLASLASVIAMHVAVRYANVNAEAADPPGLPNHKLVRVRSFIDDHLDKAISVHELASVIHMSPFHFARMFKRATGWTPHAYLTLRRMRRAQALLRDTRMPLVDIAAQVGFQTQGHFTVVFHRQVGVTPWAFRRAQDNADGALQGEPACTATDCAEVRKTRQCVSG